MQIRWLEPARVDLRVRVLHGAREGPKWIERSLAIRRS
jgi:hypothetical protein